MRGGAESRGVTIVGSLAQCSMPFGDTDTCTVVEVASNQLMIFVVLFYIFLPQ